MTPPQSQALVFRGVFYGLLLVLPFWAGIAALVLLAR